MSIIEYTLTRSKRKTVALYIRSGGVEVRAPLKMPKREIDKFIASKEKWIADKLKKMSERNVLRENFSLDYGDCVLYRGKQYPIESTDSSRAGFVAGADKKCLCSNLPSACEATLDREDACVRAADVSCYRRNKNHRSAYKMGELLREEKYKLFMAAYHG